MWTSEMKEGGEVVRYEFSNRMKAVKPSSADNILKLMGTPGLIKFSGGNPAAEAFQMEAIRQISAELLLNVPETVLQYSVTEGVRDLREAAQVFLNRKDLKVTGQDEIIITSGSAQIMDLLAKVLCNEGDRVLAEDPSFMVALNAFRSNGAVVEGVKMEEDGVDLEDLEERMAAKPTPKFFYIIPDFNNPTGITTSFKKREAICGLAAQYGVMILEDNPYGELRFAGTDIPSLKSMDRDGLVVYAGSFSKIIAPGIRVAAVSAPKPVAFMITKAKMMNDVHTSVWSQMICAGVLKKFDMDDYIRGLRGIYGRKSGVMLSAIREYFPGEISYVRPEGGMFLWVTLPEKIPMKPFVEEALKKGVALVPGDVFCIEDPDSCQSFRMNFSTPKEAEIIRGIQILGGLMRQFLQG